MIISQTPLRMSFVGGGSDFPVFYRRQTGAVVSSTVDKYVYIGVNKKFDNSLRVSYSKTEEAASADQIEHKLVRESLRLMEITSGLEITSVADIESRGTGLGSSSAFTVGLLHALHAYRNRYVSKEALAAESCKVEIDLCGEPIGKQDQYAAAFGGLNFIEFHPSDIVTVSPIICERSVLERMEQSLIAFYTGPRRTTQSILQVQSDALEKDPLKQIIVERMVALAYLLRDDLQANRLDVFGEILHENWMLKKALAPEISNLQVDAWYERARTAGAAGGKLLGAGSGGFLLFFAPPDRHEAISAALSCLRRVDFRFEPHGSRIILYQP